jgi:hypothetical protein
MTSIEKAVNKASELLLKREDENEYHFHDVDRKWVIEAMMDYAEYVLSGMSEKPNNHINAQLPKQETFGSKGSDDKTEFEKPFMDFAKQYFKPKKD